MFKTSMLPMNLQYFAEPDTDPTGTPATEPESGNESNDDTKTFSRAELASIAKAQSKKALNDFRESDEFKDLLANAKAAGVKEANMTDKEKRDADKKVKRLSIKSVSTFLIIAKLWQIQRIN